MPSRRHFLTTTAAAPLAFAQSSQTRPNILWISCEDMSPNLGCYGDPYSHSPNLDKLAAQSDRYTHAFSVAGVCAPSRSGIITAMYPTSIGTHHMRSKGVPPPYVRCFTEYLRAEGYYTTNNVKTDYNFDVPHTAWDAVSNKAHWRNRPRNQPFFSVFNIVTTHESQIRADDATLAQHRARFDPKFLHDPAKAPIPPYYPDTPTVRRDIANYYDNIHSASNAKRFEERSSFHGGVNLTASPCAPPPLPANRTQPPQLSRRTITPLGLLEPDATRPRRSRHRPPRPAELLFK